MELQFASEQDLGRWDELIANNPDNGNIFQGKLFAQLKRAGGWTPRYITTDTGLAITAHERTIPLLGKLWYIPKGPGVADQLALANLIPSLRTFARGNGVYLVKIETELLQQSVGADFTSLTGLLPTRNIQPNASTVVLDISSDLDTVITSLNQKGRHAIRRAERDGVTVTSVPTSDQNCKIMYDLLRATSAGKFEGMVRDYEYYRAFWKAYDGNGTGKLFFAYSEGMLVAAAFTIILGTKATYKDGASVRERPVYGASHLLQWRIIEWLKTRGVTSYDLCGTPPSAHINDESDPYYGIGRFKTSFSNSVTDYIGTYDLPIRPLPYRIWTKAGERVVKRIRRMNAETRFFY